MIARLFASSLVRFGLVAVAGLGVDLGTAWLLRPFMPLPLAALCGFGVGAAFNYLLHERWTFGTRAASARRGSLYLLALLATLGTRVGTVALLDRTALPDLPVLILATGVSFVVNYLLSRFLVFRPIPNQAAPETCS
ncbi:putative flippase GtrA [Novosphingobium chloroacetimidivorans]|uniref:Putative flippase GtrA n=1 Tax=Novosphingobium chloroacetimidivorans TaxID=1428314 RepID=A0A7W7K9E7_9SPHN|nr:GtrA family protein [Novosphingobium chloroacetimidivorans]MBB4858144.1 putative flippase GtrA [Novosphingobium chloroacetimidivorans]